MTMWLLCIEASGGLPELFAAFPREGYCEAIKRAIETTVRAACVKVTQGVAL